MVWACTVWLAKGTGSRLIEDMTAGWNIRMNTEVYRTAKHTAKVNQNLLKEDKGGYSSVAKSINRFNIIKQLFGYWRKEKDRNNHKQAATEDGCNEGLIKHLWKETHNWWCPRVPNFIKALKNYGKFSNDATLSKYFRAPENEGTLYKIAVIKKSKFYIFVKPLYVKLKGCTTVTCGAPHTLWCRSKMTKKPNRTNTLQLFHNTVSLIYSDNKKISWNALFLNLSKASDSGHNMTTEKLVIGLDNYLKHGEHKHIHLSLMLIRMASWHCLSCLTRWTISRPAPSLTTEAWR